MASEEKEEKGGNTVQYTFRIPKSLKTSLESIAEKEDRSLSRQIISVLRRFVDGQRPPEKQSK